MLMRTTKRMKTEAPSTGTELPDEIMAEVLLRLPVKSILRFRAVCRAWAATLSSDEFCALHMAQNSAAPARPKLLVVAPAAAACDSTAVYSCSPQGPGAAELMLTLDDLRGDFVDGVAAQCRGLTLLHDAVAPAYYVVNAATRSVTRLPPCQDVLYSSAGLGFDARAKEYKVMRLLQKPNDPDVSCEVYTLGGKHGDRWRPAAGRIPSSFSATASCAILGAARRNLPPVLVNGSLHWLIDGSCSAVAPAASIITYSVTEETFGWVQSPPCSTLGAHLVELDGCLCMVRDLRHGSSDCSSALEIWKLQDYATGFWSLGIRIDMSGHRAGMDMAGPQVVIRVLGAIGDVRSGRKIIMATSGHTVHAYDAMSKNLETILSVTGTEGGYGYPSARTAIRICLFKETLAPVHKTREEVSFSSPLAKATKEILLRLPARSIVQFKRVCRQWRGFIEDMSFIHSYSAHKSMEKRTKIVIVGKGSGRRMLFHFTPLEKWPAEAANNKDTWLDSKVVCSKPCHGLNLLSTAEMDYLYNPCTGYWRSNAYPGSCAPGHAFATGNKTVGLGFNPLKQEHVAVTMLYEFKNFRSREYRLTCSVWHCRPGSGFRGGLIPPLPVNSFPPAHVSGVLYWMSDPFLGLRSEYAIVSFNVATEVFDAISCPRYINVANRSTQDLFVVELGGKLCVVLADLMANELVIWKLGHDEWYAAYVVCLKALPDYSLLSNNVMPLAVDPKDGRILLSTERRMGFYDPVDETIEELYDADEIMRRKKMTGVSSQQGARCIPFVPMLYEESLVSYPHIRKGKFLR